tara:strand:+ start:729 stop:1565 length:837 start_codon:yes stop_codon:yes gene_type:complete
MIIWIASYPKSGNTYIRSFLSAYYFSHDGTFNFDLLKNIKQFPNTEFFDTNINDLDEASNNWVYAQKKIKDQNKVKFLKTHSCLGAYKGKPFTTIDYSLGGIYIVRDPRNVISSVMNHFSLSVDEAYEFMTDIHRGTKSKIENDYSTYSYLSTWANHYKSWANSKNFRKIVIKYEDLETDKYETFRDIIVFTNTLLNNSDGVDKIKLERAIETTNFNVLKNKEKNEGFEEALYSEDSGEKKIFFNKGFNNRWKKILRDDIRKKLEDIFKNEMEDIGYK